MKDIQSFGTISEEQLDYLLEPEYGSNMGGIGLDWNGYELLLWCASDSKEKVPVRDGMVKEIRLDSEKKRFNHEWI